MPELPALAPIAAAPLSAVFLLERKVETLEELIGAWVTYLNGLDREYEILLVDDGTVETASITARLPERFPRVRLIRLASREVEGAALRAAAGEAAKPLLFYTLVDPRFQPADLGKLLKQIDKVHLIGGFRTGDKVPAFWRLLGSMWRLTTQLLFSFAHPPLPAWLGWKRHLGALMARLLFGVRYRDPGCPFRLLRREILERMPIQSNGPFVHTEILAKANFLGCLLGEEMPLSSQPGPKWADEPVPPLRPLVSEAIALFRQPAFGRGAVVEKQEKLGDSEAIKTPANENPA